MKENCAPPSNLKSPINSPALVFRVQTTSVREMNMPQSARVPVGVAVEIRERGSVARLSERDSGPGRFQSLWSCAFVFSSVKKKIITVPTSWTVFED